MKSRKERLEEDRLRRDERASLIISMFGGECMDCGSNENLHFHHRDPETKLFDVNPRIMRNLEVVKKEAEKCDLLCARCHGDRHRYGTLGTAP